MTIDKEPIGFWTAAQAADELAVTIDDLPQLVRDGKLRRHGGGLQP
jgi:hypothetical protein